MKFLFTLILIGICFSGVGQTDSITHLPVPSKVEILNPSFDKLVGKLTEQPKKTTNLWDWLTPLLIGAGLTLLTQLLIELWKSSKEKKRKRSELISKGRAKLYLIAQVLKDLAMYKVHKQYYARAHVLSNDEDSFKKHYEKGQEQRETESKLDNHIAEYFQIVTEYIVLTNNKDDFENHFTSIFQYVHPKASKFTDCITSEDLVAGLEKEELRLNTEYRNFHAIFEEIQASLT